MLRSERRWFPTFLRLCREKWVTLCQDWTTENPTLPLLETVLPCDSYRQVVDILKHHHWVARQVIYELRTQAILQAGIKVPMSHEMSHYNFHNPGRWYPGRWYPGIVYFKVKKRSKRRDKCVVSWLPRPGR